MTEPKAVAHVRGIWRRMLRAALLDTALYEEVEADRGATLQAFLVVVLSAVAAGIGGLEHRGALEILGYTVAATAGWLIWAYVAYLIGTHVISHPETRADPGQLARTLAFSSAPGVLRVFGLVSPIASAVFLVSTIWMLVAMVVAIRHALDYSSTWRALAVCAIGFPIYAATLALSMLFLGPWPL
jgi:hypothetical protein